MRPTLLGVLRTAYVLVAALVVATLLPRLGVPPRWVPDLVLVGVVATAVLRGPVHGALVGLLAGWVVQLVPPVGSPLGLTPLVMMVAGLVAGSFRPSWRSIGPWCAGDSDERASPALPSRGRRRGPRPARHALRTAAGPAGSAPARPGS